MITILPAENPASLRNTITSRLYGTRSTGTPVIRNYYCNQERVHILI